MDNEYRLMEGEVREIRIAEAIRKKLREFMFEKEQRDEQYEARVQYKKPAFVVDDMQNSYINMKESFEYVGDNSTFQKRITTILVVQWITFSFMVNAMAFFFRTPTYLCRIPLTDYFIHCSQSTACNTPLIDMQAVYSHEGLFHNFNQVSITEEFSLTCDNASWAPFSQSMFFLGGFLSGYLFIYISGFIGRRSILLIVLVLSIISLVICALAPNFSTFLIGYFLIGFCLFGYETSVHVYIGEISAIRFRTISINMLTMMWSGTPIFLPFLSLIPTWRYAFLLFAAILLLTLPFAFKCFLESPRFLVANDCLEQARGIFEKISITNNRPPYKFNLIDELEAENKTYLTYHQKDSHLPELITSIVKSPRKRFHFLDLFRYKSLRKVTLVLMYWWMFRFFMYFGINLALESILKSGLFLTLVISGGALVEVFGSFGITIMTTILYKKYKLDIMKTCLLIISISCLLMWFLEIDIDCLVLLHDQGQLCTPLVGMLILLASIKFFHTIFFSGLTGYYSEIYPTDVRSIGCGFTLTVGRLGTILVPFYINYMKIQYNTKNALSYMAPLSFLAYFLCCWMPHAEEQSAREKIEEEEEKKVIQLTTLK